MTSLPFCRLCEENTHPPTEACCGLDDWPCRNDDREDWCHEHLTWAEEMEPVEGPRSAMPEQPAPLPTTTEDTMHVRTMPKDSRPANIYEYEVTGRGSFPADMLRWDQAWPARTEDALAIAGLRREERTVRLISHCNPSTGRWASFGWPVVDQYEDLGPVVDASGNPTDITLAFFGRKPR